MRSESSFPSRTSQRASSPASSIGIRSVVAGLLVAAYSLAGSVEAATVVLENTTVNPIANGGCVSPTFNVSDGLVITDVNLGINLATPDRGDFETTLFSPLGTAVVIIAGDTTGDANDNYDVLLDDASTNPLNDGDNDSIATPFYDRTAAPSNPLAAFNGEDSQGTWTVQICDLIGGDADLGTSNRSQLTIVGDPPCAADEIAGTVYRDYDASGSRDSLEPGVSGITVTAYDNTGAVAATTTTLADGTYLLTSLAAGTYRLEFTDLPSYLQPGVAGSGSGTTVQLAAAGDCDADLAVVNPAQHCQSDPDMSAPCYLDGDQAPLTGDVLVTFPFSAGNGGNSPPPGVDQPPHGNIATAQEIGPVWGLAYQRQSDSLFATAFMKRHVSFGPEGPGAIYRIDVGTATPSLFLDLNAAFPGSTGADPHPAGTDFEIDPNSWDPVGKLSLGDIDISDDGLTLWTVNLFDRQLYEIPIGDPPTAPAAGSITRTPLPMPGDCPDAATNVRPFATAVEDEVVYVGMVCSAETTQMASDLRGYVYSFSGGSFTQVLNFPLDHPRGCAVVPGCASAAWNPWVTTFTVTATNFGSEYVYPQPWLTDIDFHNGDMLIGVRDRFGDQTGFDQRSTDSADTDLYRGDSAGDLLRACFDGANWLLESNGGCGGTSTAGAGTGEGPGGGEYYFRDNYPDHEEVSLAGLAQVPGFAEIAFTMYDPIFDSAEFFDGGILWLSNSDGDRVRAYRIYDTLAGSGTFAKGGGLGDLEALCEPAPIEIGNRLWCDATNPNGVQDPNEPGIDGVDVTLVCDVDGNGIGNGTDLTATVATSGGGFYLFNDANVTGGVPTNTLCQIRVDTTDPDLNLACGTIATLADNGGVDAGADLRDSDGVVLAPGVFGVQLNTGADGASDHSFDFGFLNVALLTLGDFVWFDTDQDGIQDGGEPGVDGITVDLYDNATCSGSSVATDVTAGGGIYGFSGLAAGTYCLQFSGIPAGWTISAQNQGGDDTLDSDADPGTAQIQNIVLAADDPDQDMGIYHSGSIGDTVWCDGAGGNGTFEPGEGVAGVTVNLFADTDCDGNADGAAIGSQDTVGDGLYSFTGLSVGPPGGPPVCYVTQVDAADTDLGTCDVPITATEAASQLDADTPVDLDNDFGFEEQPTFTLGDFVWYDTNRDGIQDAGEPGVGNINVTLYDNAACAPPSTGMVDSTDPSGIYGFSGLLAGSYCLEFSNIPAGWVISPQDQGADDTLDSDADPGTARIDSITLGPDDPDEDMGLYVPGSIGDTVWCDGAGGNGTFEPGEGVAGVAVSLFDDTDCDGNPDGGVVASQDTVGDGQYLFSDLVVGPAGSPICYVVQVDSADTDLGTCDVPITLEEYSVPLEAGAPDDLGNDFGFSEQPVFSLGDFVWFDTDQDGIQDLMEPGVDGISVDLYDNATCSGSPVDNDVTAGGGIYGFTMLLAGTYCVEFSNIPAGWTISPQDQGGDDTLDSDADPGTAQIQSIVLGPNDFDEDMGLFEQGSIGDTVWCDGAAGNGTFEPGEGVAGVTVELFADGDCDGNADGGAIASQDTVGDGQYLFDNLIVGPPMDPVCYVVRVDQADADLGTCDAVFTPAEYPSALDGDTPDDLDNDFGFSEQPVFSLGDFVWFDADQDGIQDAGEAGVAGISVDLYDNATCTGSPVDNDVTDAAGAYGFTMLLAGTYCVEFSAIPDGWTISPQDQGGDDTLDSDADPGTTQIQSIVLGPNDFDEDMGISVRGSIGDTVWCDGAGGNGTFEPGEGVAGVAVSLFADTDCDGSPDGGAIATQDTVGDGQYSFTDLEVGPPGGPPVCYVTQVDAADPDLGSCDVPITATETDSQLDADTPDDGGNDFGFEEQATYSLGDFVWYDTDQDGIQDAGEPGVDGTTVDLYGNATCTGSPVANDVTAGGGIFGFGGLTAGTYCLQFSGIPTGWTISPQSQGGDDALDSDTDPGTAQIQNITLGPDDPDQDMGIYQTGSIGDTVWCDGAAGNGTFEPGEGVAGVGVSLFADSDCDGNADGGAIASQDTVGDGQYSFTGLLVGPPGGPPVCYVTQVDAADTDLGTCDVPITATEAASQLDADTPADLDNDFGFEEQPTSTLGDFVWYDTDQDGIQDAGEPGVDGITVDLYDNGTCSGSPIANDVTAGGGIYGFSGLAADTYCLQFSGVPAGWNVSAQNQGGDDSLDSDADPGTAQIQNIVLAADDLDQDMGIYQTGSIGDTLWCDGAAGNGTFEPGEGVAGVTVNLFADTDCDGSADGGAVGSQDTVGDGQYSFTGLSVGPPGGPPVCYVTQVDTADTDLGTCDVPITATEAASQLDADTPVDLDNDFGFEEQPTFNLGDFVWYDTDRDGIQDVGEPGVENINVTLYDNAACTAPSTGMVDSTDPSGFYGFSGLLAGSYCLEFSNIPAGWVISSQDQGGDDTLDSDADPGTAQIDSITLGPDDPDEDMGLYVPGSIGDTVWCDGAAGNGTFEPGEGVAGVAVSLFDDTDCDGNPDGGVVASQDTVGDGQYLFSDLFVGPAGSPICYVVQVDSADTDLGTCDVSITLEEHSVPLEAGAPDDLDNDFGFSEQPVFSLGDLVWFDTDQDGIQDLMEPGVDGISVDLYDNATCTGSPVDNDVTAGGGIYGFTMLLAGTYCVEFSAIPAGWTISPQDQGGDDTLDSDADPGTAQIQSIVLGPNDFDEDMGLFEQGSIGDTVWCDGAAGNGTFEPGEGVAGVTVDLFVDVDCDGNTDGGAIASQDTVGDGQYLFDDLIVGPPMDPVCYVVRVDQADADLGTCDVVFTPAEYPSALDGNTPDDLDNDFGFSEQPVFSLGDFVWFDADQDGIQDAGEAGVAGISVDLYDNATCTGSPVDNDVTDAAGAYGFTMLLAGTYCVEFSAIPAGWSISMQHQGGDSALDSDADPGTAQIQSIVLGPNDFDEDVGISVRGSIGNTVWCDGGSGNGTFEPGEGLDGIQVSLFADTDCDGNANGGAIASQDTVGDGQYSFTDLEVGPPGGPPVCYLTQVDTSDADLGSCDEPINPTAQTSQLDGTNPEDDDNDFGFEVLGSIGSTVWCDQANPNGMPDPGEGLPDITVELFADTDCDDIADGSAIANQETVSDGQYLFTGLPVGPSGGPPVCYVVRVDTTDMGLAGCSMPITATEYPVQLDEDGPDSSGNDFGFPVELMSFSVE